MAVLEKSQVAVVWIGLASASQEGNILGVKTKCLSTIGSANCGAVLSTVAKTADVEIEVVALVSGTLGNGALVSGFSPQLETTRTMLVVKRKIIYLFLHSDGSR